MLFFVLHIYTNVSLVIEIVNIKCFIQWFVKYNQKLSKSAAMLKQFMGGSYAFFKDGRCFLHGEIHWLIVGRRPNERSR